MFGKTSAGNSRVELLEAEIAALKEELEDAKKEAKLNRDMLEAVNNSTHLGIWASYYNEQGVNERAVYSDEFRRMLGYSKTELEDSLDSLAKIIKPEEM